MFTGLIQTTGTVQRRGDYEVEVSWFAAEADPIRGDLGLGDSVAVDGVCLTVTEILTHGFVAAISPETLSRTTLGRTNGPALVNLEGSLRVGSKLGGHFVTGHIDGVGYLAASTRTEDAWEMSFSVPDPQVARYIVPKGSIAVNGVSLTVADCNETGTWFKVAVIPLTYAETNLRHLVVDSVVNLEGDVLGKYVEKFLRLGSGSPSQALEDFEFVTNQAASSTSPSLTSAFLAEHGYS